MGDFLRKLSEPTCEYVEQNIDKNGTYLISYEKNVIVSATGTVILNYTSIDDQNSNLISPQNISSSQEIKVYGFTSEIVSSYTECNSTSLSQISADLDAETIKLIIDLVSFGIKLLSQVVFGAAENKGADEPVTIIELDKGQTLILYNVTQDSLTDANFIFAPSTSPTQSPTNSASTLTPTEPLIIGVSMLLSFYMMFDEF